MHGKVCDAGGRSVCVDEHLLNQVIENLVSNAVKFGDRDGAIDLALGTSASLAILRISNTGHPIAAEDQGRMFERFFRGDKARTRDIDGSGLGLSRAREIARAHGGELALERSDEHTTTFALMLPLDAPMEPPNDVTDISRGEPLPDVRVPTRGA